MSTQNVSNVGTTEHEPPEMVWEVLVEVSFNPRLSADDVEKLHNKLERRLNKLVRDTLGSNQFDGGLVATVSSLRGRGEETPLFPLVAGNARFTCNLDVVQMVERLCHESDLRELAFDASGRAYELEPEIVYVRHPAHDGQAVAAMPDADAVERQARAHRQAMRSTSGPLARNLVRSQQERGAA